MPVCHAPAARTIRAGRNTLTLRRPGGSTPPPAFSPSDLAPALWIDPSDASSVTISGSSGAYIGSAGLVLPGSGSNYATAPNIAAHQITGNIDIRVKATLTDWTPAAANYLLLKYTGTGGTGYGLSVRVGGQLGFYYGVAAAEKLDLSSVANSITDGTASWVRATHDTATGSTNFYTSSDGSSWTQLGTTIAGTVGAIGTDSTGISVGSFAGTATASGSIQQAQVLSGIGGTTVFDADFENATPFVSAFTESALGAPVYVVSSTATSATASYGYIGGGGLVLPGTGANYASSPDLAASRPTGDFTLYADVTMIDWTPGIQQYIVLHGNEGTSAGCNWLLYVHTDGTLRLFRPTGSTARTYTSSVATGLADGTRKKIKVTWDQNNGSTQSEAKFYLSDDGSSWTQLGTAVTNASTGAGNAATAGLRFGSSVTGSLTFGGTIHSTKLYSDLTDSTKVLDVDFEAAAVYAPAFTESSSNAATITVVATNTPANAAGACVSQINDKSGNARHLTQGTLANMPKYWNGQNGNNCLVFDGSASSDYLTFDGTTDSVALTSGWTLFAVAADFDSSYGGTENRRLFTARRSATGADDFTTPNFIGANRAATTGYMQCNIAGTAVTGPASATGTAPFQVTVRTGASAVVRKDSVAGTGTAAAYAQSMRYLRLGESSSTAGNPPGVGGALTAWNGLIGEVYLVPSEIADGSLTSPESYNRTKWGTP